MGLFCEKREAFSVLAADTDARIGVGVGGAEECTYSFCTSVSLNTVSRMHPSLSEWRGQAEFSSSGSGFDGAGQLLPSPAVCGIHDRPGSGCLPSRTRSNTAGM